MNKLTSGKRERATSLILNHDCGSDKRGFEFLSLEDQRLVKRLESEWHSDDKHYHAILESVCSHAPCVCGKIRSFRL